MKKYVFRFSTLIEYDGEKYNCLNENVYGLYDTEKEAILDAIRTYDFYGYTFTHLFVGQSEYFVPRIDAKSILEDLAQLAVNDGYDYKLVKDGMLHCLQILDIAFDVVDLAKDERVKS